MFMLSDFFCVGALQKVSVKENTEIGSVIGRLINAIDVDLNPTIFYHILSENDAVDRRPRTFSLRGSDIVIEQQLDREDVSR